MFFLVSTASALDCGVASDPALCDAVNAQVDAANSYRAGAVVETERRGRLRPSTWYANLSDLLDDATLAGCGDSPGLGWDAGAFNQGGFFGDWFDGGEAGESVGSWTGASGPISGAFTGDASGAIGADFSFRAGDRFVVSRENGGTSQIIAGQLARIGGRNGVYYGLHLECSPAQTSQLSGWLGGPIDLVVADITTDADTPVTVDLAATLGDVRIYGREDSPSGLLSLNADGTMSFDPSGDFDGLAPGEESTFTVDVYTVPTSTGVVYQEAGGTVVVEAEHFDSRSSQTDDAAWTVTPDEAGPIGGAFSNVRGTGFLQTQPNGAGGLGVNNDPQVLYPIEISTPGTYRAYTRWVGYDGGSDSMFLDIVELKDGAGGSVADWWELAGGASRNFAASGNNWDSAGGFELNTASGGSSPVVFDISTPGTYTLRFTQREDGAAVDAFVLQLSSLSAPSGTGPTASMPIGAVVETITITVTGT